MAKLVRQVKETPDYTNSVWAMLAAILNNYYSPQDGFTVSFRTHRNNTCVDAVVFRMQHDLPEDQGPDRGRDRRLVEHMYVKGGQSTDAISSVRDELQHSMQGLGSEVERRWAIIVQGCTFYFYLYLGTRDGGKLLPWGPGREGNYNALDVHKHV